MGSPDAAKTGRRKPASRDTLLRQNRELRRRLAESELRREEAEQTLEAIRTGDVDAVLVAGPEGERIFTLHGAEQSYRLLVETVNAAAMTVGLDGVVTYANRQAERLLGVPLEQVIGAPLERFIAPGHLAAFRDLFREGRAGETAGEIELLTHGGPPLAVHLALRRLDAVDPKAVCVVATDLTERKQAEEALRRANEELEARVAERTAVLTASEAKFAALFQGSPVGITLSSADGRLLEANDTVLAMFGHDVDDVVGRTVEELRVWVDPEQREALLRQVQAAGSVRGFEARLRRRSQEVFPALISAQLLAIRGEPVLVSGVVDITERKVAEERLRDSEARFRSLYAHSGDAILLGTPGGGILAANPAACRLFGYTEDEIVRGGRAALIDPSDPRHARAHETRARTGFFASELTLRRADGSRFPADVTSAIYLDHTGERRTSMIIRDITTRKQAEARLHEALADKDALVREVHHRVKNNLQMLCDLMYLQMEAMDDPDQHPDLQDAYTRIYAIARLHEQLYRSMQSGRIQLEEYLGRLVDGFAGLYPKVALGLEADTAGLALDLDRAIHVGLIVNELITNAAKHAFPKGRPGEVAVRLASDGDRVRLQVRDNGRGLHPDLDLGHAKTLGLRTIYILSRRLEADVQIENTGGTTFTLTFPLYAEPPVEPKPNPAF